MNRMDSNNKNNTSRGPMAYMAHNSIAANLLMLILLGGGIWTMIIIQKEVFPQFQLDIVQVSVVYPGASPAEVEQGILMPVEEAIRGIQGIREVVSTAREGSGTVMIELVAGTERMKAFQDIDQAVNRIRTFPDDIEVPEVRLQSQQRDVMVVTLYGDVDIWTLRKLTEELRERLLSHPEITQVDFGNVPDYFTHVEIPRYKLREYNLSLEQVARIIALSAEDIPAGAIETAKGEILLRMKERDQWADEYGQIEIISPGSGSSLKLSDIAVITDGFEETGFHGQFNSKPSVDLQIYRIGDQSPLDIESAVKNILSEYEEVLPPGVHHRIDSNRAEDYRERLSLLTKNGILAILIVLIILTLFLEYRLAFWVMMGMVISFIGGMVFLPLAGVSINMISLFGFLVVLGIVVDDAIVVGENIYQHRQAGKTPVAAAISGVREIARPVVFSILTNIIAFIPLLFIPGTTGKFWKPLPMVVIIVLIVSLLEALFILPAHLGHATGKRSFSLGSYLNRVQSWFSYYFKLFVQKYYRPFLVFTLRHRYITFSVALSSLLIIGSYAYSDHMGIIGMPQVSADEIEAGVTLPVNTTRQQAAGVAEDITLSTREMFREHNLYEVADGIKTNVRGQNFIDVEIVMKPPDERDMSAQELIELWRNEIGDIEGVDQITFEAESGPGGWQQDISVDISHNDINVLEKASLSFRQVMETFQATRDLNDNFNKGKAQFNLRLLPEGRKLGLTPTGVGEQVRNAFYGSLSLRQIRGINEVELRVKLPLKERRDVFNLEDLLIRTSSGTEVPLTDVVSIEESEAFTTINRRDGRRVVTVGMDVVPENAVSRLMKSINDEVLPQLQSDYPGITWSFQGSQSELRKSTSALWGGFLLAIIVIYALLALAFGSYLQPFIVMTAIPFGIVGAVIGHIILGYSLSLISLMGIIALSGVVVNDSLIMIDYANRKRKDLEVFDAIHEAGLRRFRPIIITTLTTFGGLTPIILETSRQAEVLIPMAISLGFGIIFATGLILVIVPCLYMILEDITGLLKRNSR